VAVGRKCGCHIVHDGRQELPDGQLAATNGSMSSTGWFQRTAHDNPMIDTEMALDSMIHNCPNRARANRLRISAEPIRYHDLQRCAPTIRSRILAAAFRPGMATCGSPRCIPMSKMRCEVHVYPSEYSYPSAISVTCRRTQETAPYAGPGHRQNRSRFPGRVDRTAYLEEPINSSG
jgi:hypothetical protein